LTSNQRQFNEQIAWLGVSGGGGRVFRTRQNTQWVHQSTWTEIKNGLQLLHKVDSESQTRGLIMNKWINWKTILTGILMTVLSATGIWFKSVYAEHKLMATNLSAHMTEEVQQQERITKATVLLEQISKDVADIRKVSLTVMGLAKVQQDGGDRPSALVNVNGRGMMYKEGQRVRITNMESAEQQSVAVYINGTFSMPDENKLILITKRAGEILGLRPGQAVRVKLEPVSNQQ
jgi:hypothetical protein